MYSNSLTHHRLQIIHLSNNEQLSLDLAELQTFTQHHFPESIEEIYFNNCMLTHLPEFNPSLFPHLQKIYILNNPNLILSPEQLSDDRIVTG